MAKNPQSPEQSARPEEERWVELVQQHVKSLHFGVVQVVVHDSRVTQIERTERVRLNPPPTMPVSNQPDHWRK